MVDGSVITIKTLMKFISIVRFSVYVVTIVNLINNKKILISFNNFSQLTKFGIVVT